MGLDQRWVGVDRGTLTVTIFSDFGGAGREGHW